MHAPWKKSYDQARQRIKKQKHYFANKGPSSQSYRSEERRVGKEWLTLFFGAPKSLQMVTAAMEIKDTCFLEEKL